MRINKHSKFVLQKIYYVVITRFDAYVMIRKRVYNCAVIADIYSF